MRILFDQGTPAPLRRYLEAHEVKTAAEMGWSCLTNGQLLDAAEDSFDLLITTDQQLRQQQNLAGRKLSIRVLPTTSWPKLESNHATIVSLIESILAAHPHVSEAAAVGVPDPIKGEALVCFCVLKKDANGNTALAAELKESVARDLGKALAPRDVVFVDDIPKARTQK